MATYSNYALRIPAPLVDDLRSAADRGGVSMNGFIVQAVAEKVAALRARGMLQSPTAEEQSSLFGNPRCPRETRRDAEFAGKGGHGRDGESWR